MKGCFSLSLTITTNPPASTGELPEQVAASCFGPRLQAALVALSVRNRVSRRDVVELGEELFGARLSVGSVDAILTRASDALAEPYEQLLERVRDAQAINADETVAPIAQSSPDLITEIPHL